jgi:hypothetical protein
MRLSKKILLVLVIVFIVFQFIQPAFNKDPQVLPTDLTKTVNVPNDVQIVLRKACYDCHSNNTNYPWYMNVQPMGWVMASHIKDGKENLNFSEFGSYSNRKQANKLRAILQSIDEGSMPISSYTMIHTDAKLDKNSKELIKGWTTKTRDSLLTTK